MIDTGGPAFPARHLHLGPNEHGMTLRDYFAAKALQGLLAANWCESYRELESSIGWNMVAADAYRMADAMLAERGK
jgi:hypothetical protein